MKTILNKLNIKKVLTGSLILAGVVMICLQGCKQENTDQTKSVEAKTIEIFALQKGSISTTLRIPGELIAFQQVDIYAKEASFVKSLYVDVGSEVSTGKLLASMEAPEITSRLSEAESRLKAQEATYQASKANYDRILETSKTPGTIAPNDLDLALAKMNSDYAQWEAAKANYEQVSSTKNYLEIRAPFSGVISARNVNTGAYVGPSGKGSELPLFTLQEQRRLRLVVAVPETYTDYLSMGDTIRFSVSAFPNKVYKSTIKRLAGALDTRLRAQRIEVDVLNNDKQLLPGMVAEVQIQLTSDESALVVPLSAVVNSQERVFVVRLTDGKAEWVDVKKGRDAGGKVEIFGNLQPGDKLIKTASEELRVGSELKGIKEVTL